MLAQILLLMFESCFSYKVLTVIIILYKAMKRQLSPFCIIIWEFNCINLSDLTSFEVED